MHVKLNPVFRVDSGGKVKKVLRPKRVKGSEFRKEEMRKDLRLPRVKPSGCTNGFLTGHIVALFCVI